MTKRLEFNRKTRAAIIARAAGQCEKCKAAVKPGAFQIDHILAAEYGGEASIANGRLLCLPCHAEKTAQDIRGMRKAERARDKESGAIKKGKTWRKQPKEKPSGKATLPARRLFQ